MAPSQPSDPIRALFEWVLRHDRGPVRASSSGRFPWPARKTGTNDARPAFSTVPHAVRQPLLADAAGFERSGPHQRHCQAKFAQPSLAFRANGDSQWAGRLRTSGTWPLRKATGTRKAARGCAATVGFGRANLLTPVASTWAVGTGKRQRSLGKELPRPLCRPDGLKSTRCPGMPS
jgi:hypothetical protein